MSRAEAFSNLAKFGVKFDVDEDTTHEQIDQLRQKVLAKNKNIYTLPNALDRLNDTIDTLHAVLTYEQNKMDTTSLELNSRGKFTFNKKNKEKKVKSEPKKPSFDDFDDDEPEIAPRKVKVVINKRLNDQYQNITSEAKKFLFLYANNLLDMDMFSHDEIELMHTAKRGRYPTKEQLKSVREIYDEWRAEKDFVLPEKIKKTCHSCRANDSYHTIWRYDPFKADVNGYYEYDWTCDDCDYQSAQDV